MARGKERGLTAHPSESGTGAKGHIQFASQGARPTHPPRSGRLRLALPADSLNVNSQAQQEADPELLQAPEQGTGESLRRPKERVLYRGLQRLQMHCSARVLMGSWSDQLILRRAQNKEMHCRKANYIQHSR